MKTPEWATEDIPLMEEMLCACVSELNEIKVDIAIYIKQHSQKYKTEDEIGEYFLKKCIDMYYGKDLKKTERAIKSLSINLAKAKGVITTTAWDEAVEHAKEGVRLVDVARHYQGDFNPRSRIKCPFHISRDGGGMHMQVYEKTNSFHCFSCGANGNAIDYVMRTENCKFKEAIEILERF